MSWVNGGNDLFGGGQVLDEVPAPQVILDDEVEGIEEADVSPPSREEGEEYVEVDESPDQHAAALAQSEPAVTAWLNAVPPSIQYSTQFLGVTDPVEAKVTAMGVLARMVSMVGLELVRVYKTGDWVSLLCRLPNTDREDIVLGRLSFLVESGVGVYKKYLIKDGSMVYGWYLVFSVGEATQVQQAILEAVEQYPNPPVTRVKLSMLGKPLNPVGSYIGNNLSLGDGQGLGVAPALAHDID